MALTVSDHMFCQKWIKASIYNEKKFNIGRTHKLYVDIYEQEPGIAAY